VIPSGALKITLDSGHPFIGKDGKEANSSVINEEVRPASMFNVNLNLQAPDGPGHYVAKYSVRTNDADGVVVCATVSCDV